MFPDHVESDASIYVAGRRSRGKPEISSIDFAHLIRQRILPEGGFVPTANNISLIQSLSRFFFSLGILFGLVSENLAEDYTDFSLSNHNASVNESQAANSRIKLDAAFDSRTLIKPVE